jgi:hypothetical protein
MTPQEIADFWVGHFGPTLLDGEYINLRMLPTNHTQRVVNQFYSDYEEAAKLALQWSQSHNVMFGVNPRHLNNGTKEGVTRIVCLHADVDVGEGKPFGTLEEVYDAALHLPIAPSRIVGSGGGAHLYWKLKPLEATRENIERAERQMGRLYKLLGGADRVQDVSRVLRVPGTLNHKRGADVRVLYARP